MTAEERRQAEQVVDDSRRAQRRARVTIIAARLDDAMRGHLTQAALARALDTDRATVCRMLQGRDGMVSTWLAAFDAAGYELVVKRKDVA